MKNSSKNIEEQTPTRQEALQAYAAALSPELNRSRLLLEKLSENQPQVLIVEGGSTEERLSIALWLTARLNCREKTPCLSCPACLQIGAKIFCDLRVLNGAEGEIKIDAIRGLHHVISKPPYENGKKVFIFSEAQYVRQEAANALLKTFEEPYPGNCFLLLTPQREQLPSTIVSRAFVARLAYAARTTLNPKVIRLEEALATFLSTGKEWFSVSMDKNIDAELAKQLLLSLRRALISTFTKQAETNVEKCFAILPEAGALHMQDILAQAEESVAFMVNPSLVLNWLATKMFLALTKAKKRSLELRS